MMPSYGCVGLHATAPMTEPATMPAGTALLEESAEASVGGRGPFVVGDTVVKANPGFVGGTSTVKVGLGVERGTVEVEMGLGVGGPVWIEQSKDSDDPGAYDTQEARGEGPADE
jgi:hypothetical protein